MKKSLWHKLSWLVLIVGSGAIGVAVNLWWPQHNTVTNPTSATDPPAANSAVSVTENSGNFRSFSPAKPLMPFELQQVNSSGFTNDDLLGKWSFVLFGYTYCPDVCPTTLGRLTGVYRQLKQAANVQVVFVSADPLRDDIERLSAYIGYFEPEFRAVTTSHDRLFPFAQSLLLPYGIIAKAPGADYAVSHSASIALINPQGQLHGQFKPDYQVGAIPVVNMKLMAQQFEHIIAKLRPN